MKKRSILLATDLSARCDRALDRAARLASGWSAQLVVVHALQDQDPASDQPSWRRIIDPLQSARRYVLNDVGEHAHLDLEVVVEHADAAELIQSAAARFNCELIITGVARDETLGRFFLGTIVHELARKTDVPILVVKSRPRDSYRRIIVATDFSDGSRYAMERTLTLLPDAQITLFHAFDLAYANLRTDQAAARESEKEHVMGLCEEFIASSPVAVNARARIHPVCEYGEPGALLRDFVQVSGAQLVVLGTAGRTGLASVLLGSIALRLSTELPVDVVLVRRPRGS